MYMPLLQQGFGCFLPGRIHAIWRGTISVCKKALFQRWTGRPCTYTTCDSIKTTAGKNSSTPIRVFIPWTQPNVNPSTGHHPFWLLFGFFVTPLFSQKETITGRGTFQQGIGQWLCLSMHGFAMHWKTKQHKPEFPDATFPLYSPSMLMFQKTENVQNDRKPARFLMWEIGDGPAQLFIRLLHHRCSQRCTSLGHSMCRLLG